MGDPLILAALALLALVPSRALELVRLLGEGVALEQATLPHRLVTLAPLLDPQQELE